MERNSVGVENARRSDAGRPVARILPAVVKHSTSSSLSSLEPSRSLYVEPRSAAALTSPHHNHTDVGIVSLRSS